MNKLTVALISSLVVANIAIGFAWGRFSAQEGSTQFIGAVGDTQSTPKTAQIQANSASNSTYDSTNNKYVTVSILNGNSTDRVISSMDLLYTGLTTTATSTAAQTLECATSSTATTLGSNTNYILNTTVATSTPVLFVATTTPGLGATNANRIWKTAVYLNCQSTATTSSAQWLKVNYIQE